MSSKDGNLAREAISGRAWWMWQMNMAPYKGLSLGHKGWSYLKG